MELLLSLSKETSNTVAEMMKMPSHFVIGMYNALRKILEKEAKQREEAEKKANKNIKAPSMPSFSMPKIPHI
jgi:hypothetical protein